jgi:hydroxymethylglutaryl-CoA lyase
MTQGREPVRLVDVLIDVSIREGSQQPIDLRNADVDTKLQLLAHTVRTGVRNIELTSFGPAEWFSDSHRLARGALSRVPAGVVLRALYFNTSGLEDLLKYPGMAREGIFLTAATSGYREKNYRQRSLEHVEQKMARLIAAFKAHGLPFSTLLLSTAWGDRGEALTDEQTIGFLEQLMAFAEGQGLPVQGITLADTVGVAKPEAVGSLIRRLKSVRPDVLVRAHLHPLPEMTEPSIHAAIEAGVDQWEAAWGGAGGSPFASEPGGNMDIRSLVKVYNDRGLEHGMNVEEIGRTIRFLEKHTQRQIPDIPVR